MKAFKRIKVIVHESPFAHPDSSSEYVELQWGDPAYWEWSNENTKLEAGIALSEHRSLLYRDKAIPNLQRCKVLFCPCYSAAQAYYEAPLDMPIRIVPFGVDDERLQYYNRDWDIKPFKFLLIGAAQVRKGSWLGVEAFHKAFGNKKDVQLTVSSFIETPMFLRLQREYASNNIVFQTKVHDAVSLYHSHHVLVSPHLAEGWALSIPEAMATGMPCMVSRCSAPREYFSSQYGWWIEMSDMYAPVDQCLHGVSGSWRLPDVDDLAKKYAQAFENHTECQTKGEIASEYVLSNLTWIKTAQKLVQGLENENLYDNAGF